MDLGVRPAKRPLEGEHAQRGQVAEEVVHLKGADQLQALVLGPGVARHLEHLLRHGFEATLLKPMPPSQGVVYGRLERLARLSESVRKLAQEAVLSEGIVVTLDGGHDALELDPASGF